MFAPAQPCLAQAGSNHHGTSVMGGLDWKFLFTRVRSLVCTNPFVFLSRDLRSSSVGLIYGLCSAGGAKYSWWEREKRDL